MAMEVMKPAAAAYQGSSPDAARPMKTAKSGSKEETGKANAKQAQPGGEKADAQQVQPVQKDSSEQGGFGSGSGGQQTNKQLQEAVEKIKKNLMDHTKPVFGIHEGTNRVTIKIVDNETNDILKEYPPEETLDMIQKVWEMAGIMVDEKR